MGLGFGRLTVLRDSGKRTKCGHIIWLCRCSCGSMQLRGVIGTNLRNGYSRSCGCLSRERMRTKGRGNIKHGENGKNSRLYTTWVNLKRKFYNPNAINFKNYGGRKIKVCKEWLDRKTGYLNFRAWAISNGYTATTNPNDFIIDMINRKKGYQPDNCRIISRSTLMKKLHRQRKKSQPTG